MSDPKTTSSSPAANHSLRFGRYSAGVMVTAALLTVLLILLNLMAYRYLRGHDIDLTARPDYQLSPMSIRMVERLGAPYQIVIAVDPTDARSTRLADIARLFTRHNDHLSVRTFNPLAEPEAMHDLRAMLAERLAERIAPLQQALAESEQALAASQTLAAVLLEEIQTLSQNNANEAANPELDRIHAAVHWFDHLAFRSAPPRLTVASLDQAPDKDPFFQRLDQLHDRQLEQLRNLLHPLRAVWSAMERYAQTFETPEQLPPPLIRSAGMVRQLQADLEQAYQRLRAAPAGSDYITIANALHRPGLLAAFGPEGLHVQPLILDSDRTEQSPDATWLERVDWAWQVEEAMVGALATLEAARAAPRVIFVPSSGSSALNGEGLTGYRHVASRLEALGFEVLEWIPMTITQAGQVRRHEPPRREPGRRTVWIILPDLTGFPVEQIVAEPILGEVLEQIEQRSTRLDGMMIITRPGQPADDQMMSAGAQVLQRHLERWGVVVRHREVIVRQVQRYQTRRTETAHVVDRWLPDLLVTDALAGLPGRFRWAAPIDIAEADDPEVEIRPLVELRAPDLGTTTRLRDLSSAEGRSTVPITDSRRAYTIAVAAERGQSRLIAVSDPFWASDASTRAGGGAGVIETAGDLFPANSELFVNSVCWLAGLEGLIVAGPQVQAIARIGAIDAQKLTRMQWTYTLGFPAVALAGATMVWLVRRRG